jgi:hypothetical protein
MRNNEYSDLNLLPGKDELAIHRLQPFESRNMSNVVIYSPSEIPRLHQLHMQYSHTSDSTKQQTNTAMAPSKGDRKMTTIENVAVIFSVEDLQ